MKKIVLALAFVLLGSFMISGCSKDEILNHYNNIVQSAGAIELTGKLSLEGTKEKGIDDYTGTYTADYENFSDSEYLFIQKEGMFMREEKFKMERQGLIQVGDKVKISEFLSATNYSYIIEPAVAMSGCYRNADRIRSKEGIIKSIEHTPRGFIVTAEFDE